MRIPQSLAELVMRQGKNTDMILELQQIQQLSIYLNLRSVFQTFMFSLKLITFSRMSSKSTVSSFRPLTRMRPATMTS